MDDSIQKRRFLIAEILACISFILNTICVITAKDITGPLAPAWLPNFDLLYWIKAAIAIIGLFYFFTSKVFIAMEIRKFVSISTLITLWYSIPGINFALHSPLAMLFSKIQGASDITYQTRIFTQITWSIPMFIVAMHLLLKLKRIQRK